jgi:type IX secretion system PorP/SprF family membrane protein
MKTIRNSIAAFSLLISTIGNAQQDPMFTHYMYNTLSINPAYAGSRDALTVTGLHRSQWVGFEGAPLVQTITAHSPIFTDKLGVGLTVMNDKIGFTNNSSFIADFAYRLTLNKQSKLAFGLSAGVNLFQADMSSMDLDQETDPLFQNNITNQVTPSVGVGLYYSRERFYAGVSTPNLLQEDYKGIILADGTPSVGKRERHYFFIAGGVIKLTENLAFKPTTLVKMTEAAPLQADFTASFLIRERLTLGAMYRTSDAFGALIGLNVSEQFFLGYSYDYSYKINTARTNQGSHELMLRYDFIFSSNQQIHTPRYF